MKPELSTEFDSDLQFVDPDDFNGIIMDSVELFGEAEYNEIVDKFDRWDTGSLVQMSDEIYLFLRERNLGHLKLSLNMILDHCHRDGKCEYFKAFFMTNVLFWLISSREAQFSPPFEGEVEGFGGNENEN